MKKNVHKPGEVGIFWILGDSLIQHSIPWKDFPWYVIDGEHTYNFPVDHCSYWEKLRKHHLSGYVAPDMMCDLEYTDLPRGRVIYNATEKIFYVYGPKKEI